MRLGAAQIRRNFFDRQNIALCFHVETPWTFRMSIAPVPDPPLFRARIVTRNANRAQNVLKCAIFVLCNRTSSLEQRLPKRAISSLPVMTTALGRVGADSSYEIRMVERAISPESF